MKFRRINENTKGLLFAFVVSITIWFYSVLNSEYNIYLKIPLMIIPPENYSVSGKIPEKVDVLVSTVGWQILNLLFLPKNISCNISLEQFDKFEENVILTKNDFIKSINLGVSAKILDVMPSTLTINIGKMVEKVVPVELDIDIKPRQYFTVVDKPIVKPELITIKGKSNIIENIDRWKTVKVFLEDVHKPMQLEVPLQDTLHSQITSVPTKVMVYVDVDLALDKIIYDIPIRIEDGSLPPNHILEPRYINVAIRGGINKMIEQDFLVLDAKVKYSQVITDTIGIIVPQVEVPPGFTLLSIDPPYLYHRVVTKMK